MGTMFGVLIGYFCYFTRYGVLTLGRLTMLTPTTTSWRGRDGWWLTVCRLLWLGKLKRSALLCY